MVSHSLVLGYHGCDRRLAQDIFSATDYLKPSQNAWDWLGHGIYFWEDSHARADRWGREESSRSHSQIKNPAVAGAIIDLGNCLNLADADALKQIRVAHEAYLEICAKTGALVAQNRGSKLGARYLDCAVMEMLHQLRPGRGTKASRHRPGIFHGGPGVISRSRISGVRSHSNLCPFASANHRLLLAS